MQPYGLSYLYDKFAKVTPEIVLYLPRTSNMSQIAAKVDEDQANKAQVLHYCQNGNSKAICVYYGEWKEIDV
jgi:trimethylguanosine synthase